MKGASLQLSLKYFVYIERKQDSFKRLCKWPSPGEAALTAPEIL